MIIEDAFQVTFNALVCITVLVSLLVHLARLSWLS